MLIFVEQLVNILTFLNTRRVTYRERAQMVYIDVFRQQLTYSDNYWQFINFTVCVFFLPEKNRSNVSYSREKILYLLRDKPEIICCVILKDPL